MPLPQGAPGWSFEPPSPPERPGPDTQLLAAVTTAAEWYHNQLLYSADAAEARHYLESRGIGPDDWTRWQIGWAPDQWRAVTNHIANDRSAVAAGIAAESNSGRVFDVMRSRVILPVRDPDGAVVAFAGRTINDNNPDAPKYLNTRTTDLWSKSATLYGLDQARDTIAATGQASIVEGYLDVIAAHRSGITNTVAACGTAVTDDHIAAIEQAGAHQLHTAFDGDTGGQFATRAALRLARDRGLPTRVVNMPPGTDPDTLTAGELHHLWASSEPQPWAAITAQLQADPDPRRSIDASVRATEAVLDETTRQDPLTRLVAVHQTAAAHGHRFAAVLAHDTATRPQTRHTGHDNHPAATTAANSPHIRRHRRRRPPTRTRHRRDRRQPPSQPPRRPPSRPQPMTASSSNGHQAGLLGRLRPRRRRRLHPGLAHRQPRPVPVPATRHLARHPPSPRRTATDRDSPGARLHPATPRNNAARRVPSASRTVLRHRRRHRIRLRLEPRPPRRSRHTRRRAPHRPTASVDGHTHAPRPPRPRPRRVGPSTPLRRPWRPLGGQHHLRRSRVPASRRFHRRDSAPADPRGPHTLTPRQPTTTANLCRRRPRGP